MSELLKKIDARTKLAGTNKLEILLFSLGIDQRTGRKETFGINVFKVREVMRTPEITSAPEMPSSVEGMVSLRGTLVPVIDLAKYAGVISEKRPEIMIVTEYNGHTQGFLVEAVDTILRLDWSAMRVPPDMITNRMGGLVTAITELDKGTLVMMMDVEKVLAETAMSEDNDSHHFANIEPIQHDCMVYFADDSAVARRQIERTLKAMGVRFSFAPNGMQAWEDLQKIATQAELANSKVKDSVQLILTDVEMPAMDGYMLTRMVKTDPRFAGIPVLMHSSLSGNSNQKLGESVGVDAYVSKFEPQKLSMKIREMLKL
ncbi:chemotaxis protein [Craterilacuibacter sinensis]|uniref:Response regulator n=1 Tax=Craterilacuibacter sinensis TaxID=2686017 RepID=A0A845BSJ6_9NEIS|nr:chemotaxis protein [Craterilacuibacter sinensis]MXR35553.1 response regulator [Craterilacuibacter sinensis]RQW28794.1 chemotaxis signal transduction protein CheV [Rhodobacteraceae bacterium CH30]